MTRYDDLARSIEEMDAYLAMWDRIRNAKPVARSTGGSGLDLKAAFQKAGFCEADAQRCAQRMRSGRYMGFEDVCTSMMQFENAGDESFRQRNAKVTESKIATVAHELEAAARRPAPAEPPAARESRLRLEERRTPLQGRLRLLESATARAVGEARLSVCLIDVGEGSSGTYPASTLEEAARARVFAAGLHCYVDHPSVSEQLDRPERSVRDLAGCLDSDAVFRDGGLWADVRVYSTHRDLIVERAGEIGMSIRADGVLSEAPGQKPTVAMITQAYSVDFVTAAGRGGRIAGIVA